MAKGKLIGRLWRILLPAIAMGILQGCGAAFHWAPTHDPPFPARAAPGEATASIPLKVAFQVQVTGEITEDLSRGPRARPLGVFSVYERFVPKFRTAFVNELLSARPFSTLLEEKGGFGAVRLSDYDLLLDIRFYPEYDDRNGFYELATLSLFPATRRQYGQLEARFFRASSREFLKRYFFKSTAKGLGWIWVSSTLPSETMEEWGQGFARLLAAQLARDRQFFEELRRTPKPE